MSMHPVTWPTRDCGRETCAWCGIPITQPRTGRPRRWCSPIHANTAFKLRIKLRADRVDLTDQDDVEFWLAEHGYPTSLAGAI